MDHNQYNNQQSSDSFYSYNNGANQNQTNQSGDIAQGNAYRQNTGYSHMPQQEAPYQNGGYQNSGYQNNAYQEHFYQGQGSAQTDSAADRGRGAKKRKVKKQGGFGVKLAKCAALALVFGLVSGVVFQGVQLASAQVFGTTETESEAAASGSVLTQADSDGGLETTATSSTYVATDVSDVVAEVMPSIVAITNVSQAEYQSIFGRGTYESTSCGSGIIVSQDEDYLYIVTNNHVVDGATNLTVTFNDDSTVSAEVKGTDPSTDLAVIRVALDSIEEDTVDNIKVATLGNSDELRVGEASIAIGNALGYGQSVTTGCISALNREVTVSDSSSGTYYTAELIQTDAAINPGNSGGALLNAAGEVIGINSVKYSDTDVEGIGYAIPISTAMPIIEDLITKEKVSEADSAYLGIKGVDVTSDVAEAYNIPTGVSVVQVTEGSAAAEAGIQRGDIITAFDGREITSMEELSTRLQYYKAGTTVDVTIKRASNGEYIEQTISVTLGSKN